METSKENKLVLVSNPGKQYVHQLLTALQYSKIRYHFYTSFWFKPTQFPFTLISYLPGFIRRKIEKEFIKRSHVGLNETDIFQNPFFELIREFSDKIFGQRFAESMQFKRDRKHDRWVATRLSNSYKMVIGYEESCLETFKQAKALGVTTILDLAQIHYREIEKLATRFSVFGELYKNHDLRDKINKIKEEELKLADYIICLSDFAKQSLINNGISEDRIFVANLGFDPSKFQPKDRLSDRKTGKIRLIFVGTITRRKGIDLLLKVCEELSDKVELTLIGPMADGIDLLKNHKGTYKWIPFMNHLELGKELTNNDLFIFPSYLDSWAMVVLEAMATGLPVIVTDQTGAKDAVTSDSGFVIPAGNFEILKERIQYFIRYPDQLDQMGKAATEQARKYVWENYYQNIGKVLNQWDNNG